jgi:hypothetical protein
LGPAAAAATVDQGLQQHFSIRFGVAAREGLSAADADRRSGTQGPQGAAPSSLRPFAHLHVEGWRRKGELARDFTKSLQNAMRWIQQACIPSRNHPTGGATDRRTAGATAVGIAKFSDDLLITSESLPLGTPVSIQFTMNLEGTTLFDSFSSLPSNTGLDSSIFLIGQVNGTGHVYHELHRYGRAVNVTGDTTFTVGSAVGASLTLAGTLDINVRSDFQSLANSGLSDYLNSAKFFATPADPAITIVSASGHNYSAIPEPGQAALVVGAALGGLGLWRTARQRRGLDLPASRPSTSA